MNEQMQSFLFVLYFLAGLIVSLIDEFQTEDYKTWIIFFWPLYIIVEFFKDMTK